MQRTVRMLGILMRLQRDPSTLADLAAQFECSTKSIQRDLDELLVLGIPVLTSRGHGGGISIDPSWWLGPLNLTADEIETIILAIENAPFLPGGDDVLDKVRAAVRPSRFDIVAQNDARPHLGQPAVGEPASVLADVRKVMDRGLWARIDYRGGSQPGWRAVLPERLFVMENRWYIDAVDERSRAFRRFRLDRISTMEPTVGPANAIDIVDTAHGEPEYTSEVYPEVRARLTRAGLAFCQDHPRLRHCLMDGGLAFRCPPSDYPFQARDLLRMGTNCTVLAPPELIDEMRRVIAEMSNHLNP